MFVPSLQPVALGDLFEQLAANIEPVARRKGLSLKWRPTKDAVHSDPLMLRRILQNLLANATNYTQKGGMLMAARHRGALVRIEVWDTGPGISMAERDRVFEEFQRGSASERAGGTGFGLGLSIVKRMSETLEHPLELCTRVGHGTRFAISVPYAGAAAPLARINPDIALVPAQGLHGLPIIIIDNDLAVLDAMQSLLVRWGCEVRLARDVDDIAEIISDVAFQPALILADYHLDHGMSGLELISLIRSGLNQNLPAILITADRTQDTTRAAAAAGCEILHKPVRPAELRALMQHLAK